MDKGSYKADVQLSLQIKGSKKQGLCLLKLD